MKIIIDGKIEGEVLATRKLFGRGLLMQALREVLFLLEGRIYEDKETLVEITEGEKSLGVIIKNQDGSLESDLFKRCPYCGKYELRGGELILGGDHRCGVVIGARATEQIVAIDLGYRGAEAPRFPGWECVQDHATKGGAHQYYWYARHGTPPDKVVEFLEKHPASPFSRVYADGGQLVIESARLGPWIGKGGRWAKAYKSLGYNPKFTELGEVSSEELTTAELKEIASAEARVTRKGTRDRMYTITVYAILSTSPFWEKLGRKPGANFYLKEL